MEPAGRTLYEEESGCSVHAVSVVDARKTSAAIRNWEFKVFSWRKVDASSAAADDDESDATISVEEGSTHSDNESDVSFGPTSTNASTKASSDKLRKVMVWRTFSEFQQLAAELSETLAGNKESLPSFPVSPNWLSVLFSDAHDRGERLRFELDCFMKDALLLDNVARSPALWRFLAPAERPDWPSTLGTINLAVHDLPHESSVTEWWYFNTHFKDARGNDYSAFAAFFRVVKCIDKDTGVKSYAHALNWALTDVTNKRYIQEIVLDRDSPAITRKQLETGKVIKDPRLYKAYMEMLDRGAVPLPDRMFSKGRDAVVALDKLDLDFESAQVTKDASGRYMLTCSTPNGATGIELSFTPRKAPIRHGLDGIVKGHDGDDMFYYCISRCDVSGSVTVDGVKSPVTTGQGWYDHEFGGLMGEDIRIMNYAWSWAAVQLDNGCEVSVANLVDPRVTPQRLMETRAVVVDADGNRTQPTEVSFTDSKPWTSIRTFSTYPTAWHISLPTAGIDLNLEATFVDQEFMTMIAKPGFWEGRVEVSGTMGGVPVRGVGYIERNGYQTLSELDGFFKAVGKETRRCVREAYPDVVTSDDAIRLIADDDTKWYIDGVDFNAFRSGIIDPVRYITDMGGKSWRSYSALACIDVVGGDLRKHHRWLAFPEFLHVGSLIIDDIEDESLKRRGADCAHIKYGLATAINAGCGSYFMLHFLLKDGQLSDQKLNKIYDLYFAALRAGHAGQALDIAGLGYMIDDAIARGDEALPESRILAVHRLKTAVPAASLARMGALVGGATTEQIDAIGRYFEAVGLAFQIMDDVLNLRGVFSGKADKNAEMELKTRGEDITAGKVTIPVVKAISRLPREEMTALWQVIKSRPRERAVVDSVIAKLEACGAIDACVQQARALVDDSYAALQPLLPDSFTKIMLRAFGYFVVDV